VSHDLERTLVDKVKVRPPVQVIHNGIDGSRFGGPKDNGVRRSLGIADDAFVFGTAVVISEQKGITFLLDAAKRVVAEAPEVTFLIAGDGPLRVQLEARSKAEGLEPKVRFLGYRSDIPQLLASYDTYVLSSLWEGLPLALLEALALGLPVVCTTVGGNPEVIEHGKNGFLVPPRDSAALAEHLLKIYRDKDFRARIRTESPKKFEIGFSMDAMVRQYLRLFDAEMAARAA
jgi:glycosyltransferase involved in cell wall biosynthesis